MSEYKEVGIEDILSVVKKRKGRRDTKIIQKHMIMLKLNTETN